MRTLGSPSGGRRLGRWGDCRATQASTSLCFLRSRSTRHTTPCAVPAATPYPASSLSFCSQAQCITLPHMQSPQQHHALRHLCPSAVKVSASYFPICCPRSNTTPCVISVLLQSSSVHYTSPYAAATPRPVLSLSFCSQAQCITLPHMLSPQQHHALRHLCPSAVKLSASHFPICCPMQRHYALHSSIAISSAGATPATASASAAADSRATAAMVQQNPECSFSMDCTGDVCKGDTVLFKQAVYGSFDVGTRRGALIGKSHHWFGSRLGLQIWARDAQGCVD